MHDGLDVGVLVVDVPPCLGHNLGIDEGHMKGEHVWAEQAFQLNQLGESH